MTKIDLNELNLDEKTKDKVDKIYNKYFKLTAVVDIITILIVIIIPILLEVYSLNFIYFLASPLTIVLNIIIGKILQNNKNSIVLKIIEERSLNPLTDEDKEVILLNKRYENILRETLNPLKKLVLGAIWILGGILILACVVGKILLNISTLDFMITIAMSLTALLVFVGICMTKALAISKSINAAKDMELNTIRAKFEGDTTNETSK